MQIVRLQETVNECTVLLPRRSQASRNFYTQIGAVFRRTFHGSLPLPRMFPEILTDVVAIFKVHDDAPCIASANFSPFLATERPD
jgi:hypothetical protein